MKKKEFSATKLMALSAGVAALAASTYYFFGPASKIHRQKAVGWMIKIKGEIIEKLEETGDVTEAAYHGIVDSVLSSYITAGKVAPAELKTFTDNLKGQWKHILKTIPVSKKKAAKKSLNKEGSKK